MEPGSSTAAPGSAPARPRELIGHACSTFDKMPRRECCDILTEDFVVSFLSSMLFLSLNQFDKLELYELLIVR